MNPRLRLDSRKAKKMSLVIPFVAVVLLAHETDALEWQVKCGTARSSTSSCTLVKGEAALKGETGTSYTYILPSGDRFQRFVPDPDKGTICESGGSMRKNNGSWFRISTYCEGKHIIHSLPSGNTMLVEIYDSL